MQDILSREPGNNEPDPAHKELIDIVEETIPHYHGWTRQGWISDEEYTEVFGKYEDADHSEVRAVCHRPIVDDQIIECVEGGNGGAL